MRLGVVLPTFGERANATGVRAVAEAAEALGFDSVWASEHVIVGPAAAVPYGRILDPFATLAFVAGFTERIALGTSVALVPLHHPMRLAKLGATLAELSGDRFRLGVGVGAHEDEFRFMGADFGGRDAYAEEAFQVLEALWSGAKEYHGARWSFEDATFAPVPVRRPEIWVGGGSARALQRAREHGDVWHPSSGTGPQEIRAALSTPPELRVVPRLNAASVAELVPQLERFHEAGCEGAVVNFGTEPQAVIAVLRDVARDIGASWTATG